MTDGEKLARIFKALSAETRVRIVQLLKGRAMCVGALSARLNVTQGAVSQHLRVLRNVDLLIAEKRGYFVHYRLNDKTLARWQRATARLLGTEPETQRECPGTRGKSKVRGVCK
jgi:DNA-binding transcriptional ArsR family regulator